MSFIFTEFYTHVLALKYNKCRTVCRLIVVSNPKFVNCIIGL